MSFRTLRQVRASRLFAIGEEIPVDALSKDDAERLVAIGAIAPDGTKAAPIAEGDDLTLIKGVGKSTAAALVAAGVGTFADLAAADPAALMENAAFRGLRASAGDVAAWVDAARLRVVAADQPLTVETRAQE